MRVSEVASADVITIGVDATVRDAVERMLDSDVGSAVVTDEGVPGGILTKSDVLRAAYRTDDPLSSIGVSAAASAPLITIGPDASARRAAEKLHEHDVHRLVVVDGMDVVGVVSTTDLIRNYGGIRSAARRRADAEYDWVTGDDVR
ncbi:CBS domain-containing protein [Halobellus clavatus]|jgi:CBS domain-containing protein|uniref:CBS domain-containing protein n=1 Tax=Halobellus clavatus TaxID=660517 RepID=A0A1H3JS70_9EURY|nr:CBS domain-containing protein [Halobellus clavatus]SDY42439.1 CBS domain-containing protein [Halobellus clavatus]